MCVYIHTHTFNNSKLAYWGSTLCQEVYISQSHYCLVQMSANSSQWSKYSLPSFLFVLSEGNEWLLHIYVITDKPFYKNGCLKSWEQYQYSPKEQGEWFPEFLYESIDVSNNAQVFLRNQSTIWSD